VYVDDGILISPNNQHVVTEIELLKQQFNISEEGTLSDYVGVNIERASDGSIHMTQPQLKNSILHELNFNDNTIAVPTPALSSMILKHVPNKQQHKADWSYRRIIGKFVHRVDPGYHAPCTNVLVFHRIQG
jgi:hypothetical protein